MVKKKTSSADLLQVGRRSNIIVASCGAFVATTLAIATFTSLQQDETFCATVATIVGSDSMIKHNDLVIMDQTMRPPIRCGEDELWHYPEWTLERVDGVVFNDCRITWVDGGRRTPAADIDFPCSPVESDGG